MKLIKLFIIVCQGCGETLRAKTKKQAMAEAKTLGWYHVNTRPKCRACELAEVRARAEAWEPRHLTPF